MWIYVAKRTALIIPTLLGVVTLVFVLVRLAPGNPIEMMLPPNITGSAQTELIRRLTALYGFNRPLYVQYLDYLWQVVRLQFGLSLQTQLPVLPQLLLHFWATLQLAIVAFLGSVLLGVPAGVVSAVRRNSWLDSGVMLTSVGGISIPTFVLAYVLIYFCGVVFNILPPSGYSGPIWTWHNFTYVVLPAFSLAAASAGVIARFTRSSMLEIMHADHVRTARAKGVAEWRVVNRHVLRNALIPILTVVGLQMGGLLGGVIIVENVFGWPGVGQYIVNGVNNRDYPVVQASAILIAAAFVVVNLLTDLTYAWVDPRIRYD
jgi:peptide/nickel transport system permease protein